MTWRQTSHNTWRMDRWQVRDLANGGGWWELTNDDLPDTQHTWPKASIGHHLGKSTIANIMRSFLTHYATTTTVQEEP